MREIVKIEVDEKEIAGILVDLPGINKIARIRPDGLTYCGNVMDDNTTKCYMLFRDENGRGNYLVRI